MTELKVGDVVRLKSGGPAMTVTAIPPLTPDNEVGVAWFEKAGEVWGAKREVNLALAALEPVPAPAEEKS